MIILLYLKLLAIESKGILRIFGIGARVSRQSKNIS